MITLEPNPRNKALLRLLYGGGLRVSELCGLRWRDVLERDDSAQITVFGKGGRTRHVLLSKGTWPHTSPRKVALHNQTGAMRHSGASSSKALDGS